MRTRNRLAVVFGSAILFLVTVAVGGCGGDAGTSEVGVALPTAEEKAKLEAVGKRAASEK